MPLVQVTGELGKTIKNTRNNKGIKASELAKRIGKSIAYISKIENADLKYIDLNMLIDIFKFLIGDEENFEEFVNKILEKLHIELTPKEIEEQNWAYIFDNQIRQIPIPQTLVQFLVEKTNTLAKSPEQIIEYINENDELKEKDINIKKIEPNTLIHSEKENNWFIVFNLEKDLLTKIIQRQLVSINYIKMEGIVRALFKLESYPIEVAARKTIEVLNEHKFYTLREKRRLLQSKKHSDTIDNILTEYDTENTKIVKKILSHIKILSDWDIDSTNKRLKELDKNFESDPSFTLAVLGMSFYNLEKINVDRKKEFLKALKSLIDKYSIEEEKEIVSYDDI